MNIESDSWVGSRSASVAADVWTLLSAGAVGVADAPVKVACSVVNLSLSAGRTLWNEMSISPFSS